MEHCNAPFAVGIPEMVRLIYFYGPTFPWTANPTAAVGIEPAIRYQAYYWVPRCGEIHDPGMVEPDTGGRWPIPLLPTFDDWVPVLEATEARCSLLGACWFDRLTILTWSKGRSVEQPDPAHRWAEV